MEAKVNLYEKISIDRLVEMMDCKENVQIIDVRQADYDGGHLRGSIHIPFHKFTQEKAEELVKLQRRKISYFYACTLKSNLPHLHLPTLGCDVNIIRIT